MINNLDQLDTKHRVINPRQAIEIRDLGVKQISLFAWKKYENGEYGIEYEPCSVNPPYKCFDWSTEKDSFAAFDDTELDFLLQSIGQYTCGPVFQYHPDFVPEFDFWCDHLTYICDPRDSSIYAVYGSTPAEAKGNMLIKIIKEQGTVPFDWPYFVPERMQKISGLKSYGK